jgi:hypothetical protein
MQIVTEDTDTLPMGALVARIESDCRIVFEVDLATVGKIGLQVGAKIPQLVHKAY